MPADILEKLRKVKHFTQVDPANEDMNDERLVELISKSGTDALIFAGTDRVDAKNLEETVKKFEKVNMVKIVAPSCPEMVPVELCKKLLFSKPPLIDGIFPYVAYNSLDVTYITQLEKKWLMEWNSMGEKFPIDKIREMPYLIVTHTGTVGKKVPLDKDFSIKNIMGYAAIAIMRSSNCFYQNRKTVFNPPLLYLETTGYDKMLTGVEPADYVRACRSVANDLGFNNLYLISGGEIRNEEEARKRIEAGASAINVGNPLYFEDRLEGFKVYLSTVRGVKPNISRKYHKKLLELIEEQP